MTANPHYIKNKTGRPKKEFPRKQCLGAWCTIMERKKIESKARFLKKSVSEFLRLVALNKPIDLKEKSLPKEVLFLTGTLNHLAAKLTQLTNKNDREDNLIVSDKVELNFLAKELHQLANDIKSYLQ